MTGSQGAFHRVRQMSTGVGLIGVTALISLCTAADTNADIGGSASGVTPLFDAEAGGAQLTLAESLGSSALPTPYESLLEGQATVEQGALLALRSTEAIQSTLSSPR